jgi:hypothetical protein
MPTFELISLALLGLLAWFWLDSMRARDAGIHAARAACVADGLQLLDDSVAIASVKTARDDDGQFVLQRTYHFEYSDTGDNRRRGNVVLLGRRVMLLNLGPRLVPDTPPDF